LYKAWIAGDTARALEIHEVLRPMAEAMFIENSPAPLKFLLGASGLMTPAVRLPIADTSPLSRETLGRLALEYTDRRRDLLLST
jgi:4-hydroxy-tetrahydrodipicolinate synthase